jgi:hypothetical protein
MEEGALSRGHFSVVGLATPTDTLMKITDENA